MNKVFFLPLIALALVVSARAQNPGSEGYKAEIQVTPLVRTTTTTAGQPIVYPKTDHPEVRAVRVEIPPGAETGWHKHPVPCYAYLLAGTLTVEIEGETAKEFNAGQALVESVNLLHNGKNTGTENVVLVMFVMGAEGSPFTVRGSKPE